MIKILLASFGIQYLKNSSPYYFIFYFDELAVAMLSRNHSDISFGALHILLAPHFKKLPSGAFWHCLEYYLEMLE